MRTTFTVVALTLAAAGPLCAAPADDGAIEFFEKKIRPVLADHCYSCHSQGAKEVQGGLLLDSRAGTRKGGDSGPAVVPGDPNESLLVKAVRYDGDLQMPPAGKLPPTVIADLEAWVRMGAPDPRAQGPAPAAAAAWTQMLQGRRRWWSLQPVRKPTVPAVQDTAWPAHAVDRFVLARLEEHDWKPVEPADPRTLVRRLCLVLTGLPPEPGQVEAFIQDSAPDAAARLVDRLLASPHFGERWARHWLDVVRFSETHGNEWNYEVHHAWRYRDYLIRAFNQDVAYDQLVREHIAGDLLPQPRWNDHDAFEESVIGTAFYRFGEVNHDDCIGLRQIGFDLADNQIDTLSKAFQATTVACARCHDHKLDAVSMADYYALLGVIRSSRQVSHTIDAPGVNAKMMERLKRIKSAIRQELGQVWLREAGEVARYMRAAHARHLHRPEAVELAQGLDPQRLDHWGAVLQGQELPLDDPMAPWRLLALASTTDGSGAWRTIVLRYEKEDRERSQLGQDRCVTHADFAAGLAGWQAGGQGLRGGPTPSGDFVVCHGGDTLLDAVLPAGCFTHTLSQRLNGTLRSPVLFEGKKHISFLVMGQRSSAVRLVSNNCQLNYKNYRALNSNAPHWVTFELPPDRDSLRVYAELMTMFDNPKFPDQLSSLGGDKENYRLPWETVAANPRSYFGVSRVVSHDEPEPPKPPLGHLRRLFEDSGGAGRAEEQVSLSDLAGRYAAVVENAVRAWAADQATDDDASWLESLRRRGLLGNRIDLTPCLRTLAEQYRRAEATLALPRITPGLGDFGPGFDQPIFVRGDCFRPSEVARRRYLEVLSKPGERFETAGSGRLELAERIASPDNPLTARVMVNRVWHHLFGTGLVRTVDDFGRVGDVPSHPELLDHLAARFVEEGWSIKRLVRSLVLTQTFGMASRPRGTAGNEDPQNRLLHHYPARRMEAESIRDCILAASGRLDRTLYGPSISSYREKANSDRRLFGGPLDGDGRRSIYIKNTLMESPRFLGIFDLPGGKVAQGRRDVTNVPAQALALLNDPFVVQQADLWAARLVAPPDPSNAARIEQMFQAALGRPPSPEEVQRFEQAAVRFAELLQAPAAGIARSRAVWADLAHTMFNAKEFLYIP